MLSNQFLNKHFHHERKGCKIIRDHKDKGHLFIKKTFCETHQKEICRCGWEWQWHYGTYIEPIERRKIKLKKPEIVKRKQYSWPEVEKMHIERIREAIKKRDEGLDNPLG